MGSQSTGPRGFALPFVNMAPAYFSCAHLVIIKGTQVYDSSKGSFVDLSVLDVFQVFGRAGRPGFETSGRGYICTTGDKLQHYLDAVTSQVAHRALISARSRLTSCADSHRVAVCTSSYGKTVTDNLSLGLSRV
jgi:replicative superfamily II helicase